VSILRLDDIPGKLMIAGEYAVLRPGGACLAVAAGAVVHGVLGDAASSPRVVLTAFGHTVVFDAYDRGADHVPDGLAVFAENALAVLSHRYGVRLLRHWNLTVRADHNGAKVGLGSSAAVTVAAIRAAVASNSSSTLSAGWNAEAVAACARQVHNAAQGSRGSGYDVTTIAHGGAVAFARGPDRARELPWPADLHAAALFCGTPSATQAALAGEPIANIDLDAIQTAADAVLRAWLHMDAAAICGAIAGAELAFEQAAKHRPSLAPAAVESAKNFIRSGACVARTSGAGGGDCVLAFADRAYKIGDVVADWRKAGGFVAAVLPADVAVRCA